MPLGGFDILVGSVNGLLKGFQLSETAGSLVRNVNSVQDQDKVEITCLACKPDDTVLVGGSDGTVRNFVTQDRSPDKLLTASIEDGHKLRGLFTLEDRIIAASTSGVVSLYDDAVSLEDDASEAVASFDVIKQSLFQSGKLKKGSFVAGSEEESEHVGRLSEGRDLSCLVAAPRPHQHLVATAGKENDLQMWDINRAFDNAAEGCVFRAKNVSNDKLELRVPVWISGVAFQDGEDACKVSVVSKHGHIRQYDTRSKQRRPVLASEWLDEAPTSCAALGPDKLVVGAGTGKLAMFDWRGRPSKATGLMVQKYKGCVGSVRSLAVPAASQGRHFVSVGLDRYLRIYDVDNPKPVHKVYMKSKLNCMMVSSEFEPSQAIRELERAAAAAKAKKKDNPVIGNTENEAKENEGKEEDAGDEKFWTKMKIIREKPKKRKNPSQGGESNKRINR